MNDDFRIYLFGEFRLYRQGKLISAKEWHTRQARQLFKVLLTEYEHPVSAQRLMDLLWPDQIDHPDKTLRSAISMLRTVLEPERDAHTPSRFLPRGRAGYMLTFPQDCSIWIDTREFERLLTAAVHSSHEAEKRTNLEAALALFTGNYLANDEEVHWTRHLRDHFRECYFQAVLALMDIYRRDELFDLAIALGRRSLQFDPCNEPTYRSLMQCQALLGNGAGALQTFEQCRITLADILGADPSPQTLELHTTILNGTFAMPSSQRVLQEPLSSAHPVYLPASTPIVGRESELAWLHHFLESKQATQRATLISLTGEAGVGKSFLLHLFCGNALAQGFTVHNTVCQALEQGLSFAPLVALIRSWLYKQSEDHDEAGRRTKLQALPRPLLTYLAPLLSEKEQVTEGIATTPSPQEQSYALLVTAFAEFFTQVARTQPLVLVMDDLQWADEATLLVLNRLAALETPEHHFPLLLLVSYRPEDVSENQALRTLLHALGREQRLHILSLHSFTREEVEQYLRLNNVASQGLAEQLYQTTQGNGLFMAEAVRTLREQQKPHSLSGLPEQTSLVAQQDIRDLLLHSPQIRDIVLARTMRLPARSVELLERASVMRRPFAIELLGADLTEQDYLALDVLLARHFLVEIVASEREDVLLSFSHELIREVVYDTCTVSKRKRMHQRIVEHLLAHHTQAQVVEIAYHALHAGPQYTAQALCYAVHAANYSRQMFSYRQALEHYNTALRLLQHIPATQQLIADRTVKEWQRSIYDGRQLVYEVLFDWNGLQESHHHLSTWASQHHDIPLKGSSDLRLAIARSLMGQLSEALSMGRSFVKQLQQTVAFYSPLSAADTHIFAVCIFIMNCWIQMIDMDEPARIEEEQPQTNEHVPFPLFRPASFSRTYSWQEIYEHIGPAQAAFFLATYGWVLLLQGHNADAEKCLKTAQHAAEETDQETWWIFATLHLSHVYALANRPDQSTQMLMQSLQRSQQLTEASWTTIWPLLYQAYGLLFNGNLAEAESILLRLQAQFSSLQDFVSHRFSMQIGFGLLALARGNSKQAAELLRDALCHRTELYVEAYILAELGMTELMATRSHYEEAIAQLHTLLTFCGQRGLLEFYCTTALALVRILTKAQILENISPLLSYVKELAQGAGYGAIEQTCDELYSELNPHKNSYSS